MEAINEDKLIVLKFTDEEALVMLEWLHNFNLGDHFTLFRDQAEKRILFDLEAELERVVSAFFEKDYENILKRAWDNLRDQE